MPEGPGRLQVLQNRHDSRLAGHYGVRKTVELVARDYGGHSNGKYVKDFVGTCDICARAKAPRHKPYGYLQPMPVPTRPWGSVFSRFYH